MNDFFNEADDYYVRVDLNTEMALPTNRDTVLHDFEQIGRQRVLDR